MNIQQFLQFDAMPLLFQQGCFGLEKEGQRITANGNIANSFHPKVFGLRKIHPYIQTDFAESQLELITPVSFSISQALNWMRALHDVVNRNLEENEYLLPLSMPLFLPKENEIKEAQLEDDFEVNYRKYLSKVYGKYKQMVSGVHYNFQISEEFVNKAFLFQTEHKTLVDFKNAFYMKLANNFLRYQWILIYLLSSSITAPKEYFNNAENIPTDFVRSIRSGIYGYINHKDVQINHDNIQSYVESLEEMVNQGKLIAEKEFYSNVRLRGAKKAREFLTKGVSYVEIRLLDINPFEITGLSEKDAKFIHYFLLTMLWLDKTSKQIDVNKGLERLYKVTSEHPLSKTAFADEGKEILCTMLKMLEQIGANAEIIAITKEKLQQFDEPSKTLAGIMVNEIAKHQDYASLGVAFAKKYKENSFDKFYQLAGFTDLELSTQALIFDALTKGVAVEVLDSKANFLALTYNGKTEYVQQGNMTAHDTYIAPLIMANKVVTKKVLAKQGFNVPKSVEFCDLDQAVQAFEIFKNKPLVVKPKSTNFGLGISIFANGIENKEDFATAVKLAFKEDHEIMLEDFVKGTEYRFFVLGDETLAVLNRTPANVVGDGIHTIKQLVEIKNQEPLRGDGIHSPLKKIVLGEIENLQLKEQNLSINSIPAKDQIIYLRANSNISTGGDSIDCTDKADQFYKDLAVNITKACKANICGVDLLIEDLTKSNGNYAVVETNFNPMMMMHIFPAQGKSRRVTQNVLKMLFNDLDF